MPSSDRSALSAGAGPAHARPGDRIVAAYLGGDSFDRVLATFAEHWADQSLVAL